MKKVELKVQEVGRNVQEVGRGIQESKMAQEAQKKGETISASYLLILLNHA